jgi:hypothetical protein
MNAKKILVPVLAIAFAAAVASVIFADRKVAPTTESPRDTQPAKSPAISESIPPRETPAVETKPQIQPAPTNVQPVVKPQNVAAQTATPANGSLQDPVAREALSLVGVDSDAEQYWAAAIFDPTLPDQEREDLMEDLNEDGLSDPQHPGPQDLPLIVNRIRIIEQIAPFADDFMLEHLWEADKDLRNMLAGEPVQ